MTNMHVIYQAEVVVRNGAPMSELLHQLSGYHSNACKAVRCWCCLHGKDIVEDITDQEPNRKLSTKDMHRRQPLTMVILAIPQVAQPPLPMKHPNRISLMITTIVIMINVSQTPTTTTTDNPTQKRKLWIQKRKKKIWM